MVNLQGSKILVVGGTGFLGSHLTRHLEKTADASLVVAVGRKNVNLLDTEDTYHFIKGLAPDYVFNCAGWNGGLAWNNLYPFEIFYRNTIMNLNLIEVCGVRKVKKVLSVIASCAYPEMAGHPVDGYVPREVCFEEELMDGPPHDSVACHAYAKRNLQIASELCKKQYGLNSVTVCPCTLYGPGDNYDPRRTKVVGAMIKRFADASQLHLDKVQCWGSGKPLREIMYVADAARLLVRSMERWECNDYPLNLGSGQELSIKSLAIMCAAAVEYKGKISWDASRPDGQMRKLLNTQLMKKVLGPQQFYPVANGLVDTAMDYLKNTYFANSKPEA